MGDVDAPDPVCGTGSRAVGNAEAASTETYAQATPPATIDITVIVNVQPGVDRATCEINGRAFVAESEHGAIHELARQVRDAGFADRPWQVAGRVSGSSFYWMAERTITEKSGTPRTRLWNAHSFVPRGAEQGGASPSPGPRQPGDAQRVPAASYDGGTEDAQ
jgi:hypothetical protein